MSIDHLLNITASLKRATTASDGQGGNTKTFAEISTPKLRRSPLSISDRMEFADKDVGRVTHAMYFNANVDILREDQILVDSRLFIVQGFLDPSEPDHQKVLVEETQP